MSNTIKSENRGGKRMRAGRKPLPEGEKKRLINLKIYLSDRQIAKLGGLERFQTEVRTLIFNKYFINGS